MFDRKEHNKKWQQENKEKIKVRDKKYYEKNKEKVKARTKAWYEKNKEHIAEIMKKWRRENPEKAAANDDRRLEYLKDRTPEWADMDKIKEIYLKRNQLNNEAGHIKYHVDHEIPLNGEFISGLHVENNLQILTATDNLRKGNRYGALIDIPLTINTL